MSDSTPPSDPSAAPPTPPPAPAAEAPAPEPPPVAPRPARFSCEFDPVWIRKEREEQGLSFAELSRRTGLSVAEVKTVERSRAARTSRVAIVLATLGVRDPDELRARHGPDPNDVGIDGGALRTLREARGMSVAAASRRAGISRKALQDIEDGTTRDPSLRIVLRLLRAYGADGQVARFVVVRNVPR